MEATRFTNTSMDEIGINDSSRYPPDEFLHEDDPSRQYQANFDISYYVIPHGSPDLTNTEGTHKQNVQDEQIITQSTKDRWPRDQHIKLVNIIGDPGEGMLTRSMDAKLTAASTSECLFDDFLSKIELKKISEALKHPGWVDVMQEELNKFYRNKVWTLVPLLYAPNGKDGSHQEIPCLCNIHELHSFPNGCQKCIPKVVSSLTVSASLTKPSRIIEGKSSSIRANQPIVFYRFTAWSATLSMI
ncbi:hypothetical protein Tco_0325189 [Tanacetum coccineum]